MYFICGDTISFYFQDDTVMFLCFKKNMFNKSLNSAIYKKKQLSVISLCKQRETELFRFKACDLPSRFT